VSVPKAYQQTTDSMKNEDISKNTGHTHGMKHLLGIRWVSFFFFLCALALAWKGVGGGSAGPCKWIFTCMGGGEGGPHASKLA